MKYANLKYNAVCPVCSHSENRLLYKVSSQEASNHFLITQGVNSNMLSTVSKKIIDLWNKDTAAVILCNNCVFELLIHLLREIRNSIICCRMPVQRGRKTGNGSLKNRIIK